MSSAKTYARRGLTYLLNKIDPAPVPSATEQSRPDDTDKAARGDWIHAHDFKAAPGRWPRVQKLALEALDNAGVTGGRMLEIGGRANPRKADFPAFDYSAMDLAGHPESTVHVEVGDITDCPHIPDESFEFIFSFDVFEHISRPWLAGSEITRLLKPGGVTVHSTLFSWRYHPCPGDYFRYTPEGLKMLFPDLICLSKDFDYTERRRNIIGRDGNRVTPDKLGGWRENVRVHYAGMKR